MYTPPRRTGSAEVEVSVFERPAHTVVRLRGYVDIATAPPLRRRLQGVPRSGGRLLILDLSGVSFCDAAGLAVLISIRRRAILLDVTLRLRAPFPQVARLLRTTGLDRTFATYPAMPDTLVRLYPRTITARCTRMG